MVEKKHYKLLVILALLVLANILNAFFGKETTLEYKMQEALESHDHENALIFASKLLEQESGNEEAIKIIKASGQILLYLRLAQAKLPEFRVAKDQDTGQVFFYVHTGKSSSADLEGAAEDVMIKPEKVYEKFNNARAYTAKAKALDSRFKTTINFENSLDEAQTYVLNILAANVFDVGKSVYSTASQNFEKRSALIDSAEDSEYLDKFLAVQSAWAPMETPVDKIKQNINPLLDKMNDTGRLVAGYKVGNTEKLSDSLLTYIQVVRSSVNTLLLPKGNYKDFIILAKNTTKEYQIAQKKLKRVLPRSVKLNNFSKLVKAIIDYKLFKNDATVELIKENQYLQEA